MSLAIAFDATRTYAQMPRTESSVLTNSGLTHISRECRVVTQKTRVSPVIGRHSAEDQSRSVTPHLSVSSRTTSCTVTSSMIPASATEATLSS